MATGMPALGTRRRSARRSRTDFADLAAVAEFHGTARRAGAVAGGDPLHRHGERRGGA